MPSTSYDFSQTRDELITASLRYIGAIDENEAPTAAQITQGASTLNRLVKAWQSDGLQLWARKSYTQALTIAKLSYTIGVGLEIPIPKPLRILDIYLRDTTTNNDISLRPISQDEYLNLSYKVAAGRPINYFYDPQLSSGELYLFPVTDKSNLELHILYHAPFADFDASTDTPDFPQEWYQAIVIGLAAQLAPSFGISIKERQILRGEASQEKALVESFDQEDTSIYFAPAQGS